MRVTRLDLGALIDELIVDVPLPRDISEFRDGISNLLKREMIDRPRFGNDVFLDHQRAHVVGAVEERHLAHLLALRDPARLDVLDVVEVKPRHGVRFEVLE